MKSASDVLYGNIGTPERIEFSVIGAAANERRASKACARRWGIASSSRKPWRATSTVNGARSAGWLSPPLAGFTTILLLPDALSLE